MGKVFSPGPVGPLHGEHVAVERRDRGGDRRDRARLVGELAHGRPPFGLAGLEISLVGVGVEPVLDSEPQSGGGPANWGEREEAGQLRARVPCGGGSAPRPQAKQHLGPEGLSADHPGVLRASRPGGTGWRRGAGAGPRDLRRTRTAAAVFGPAPLRRNKGRGGQTAG